jgi:hypothetical protein
MRSRHEDRIENRTDDGDGGHKTTPYQCDLVGSSIRLENANASLRGAGIGQEDLPYETSASSAVLPRCALLDDSTSCHLAFCALK